MSIDFQDMKIFLVKRLSKKENKKYEYKKY
jgi:hypothetical protein